MEIPKEPKKLPREEIAGLVRTLEEEMTVAAEALEFELAAAYRDKLRGLRRLLNVTASGRGAHGAWERVTSP